MFMKPFDLLRANGGVFNSGIFPFVVSLSNHERDFFKFINS